MVMTWAWAVAARARVARVARVARAKRAFMDEDPFESG
jgi:hypothetical protein